MKDIHQSYFDKFQELSSKSENDPQIKNEIFETLSKIEHLAKVIDLFTVKFVKSEAKLIDYILKPSQKKS